MAHNLETYPLTRGDSSAGGGRLAVVVSHPIQYLAPVHRELARIEAVVVRVFFCCDWGVEPYRDRGFDRVIQWDVPLTTGYDYEFLPIGKRPTALTFRQVDNPTVGEALARFRPDVVQVFGYAHRTNWRVARWCRATHTPLLLTSDSHGGLQPALWKRAAKRVVVGRYYSFVDGATYAGDNNRAYHSAFGVPGDRLFSAPLPVDREGLLASVPHREQARREVRRRYGIPQNAFVVLFCGKLTPWKRPQDVVRAATSFGPLVVPPVWALLVGDGPMRRDIELLVATANSRNTVMTGFANQSAIGQMYAAADVHVLSSEVEPYGLVVSEASAFGLPSIVSDRVGCVGPSGAARPGLNAIVYPCGDTLSLAAAIARLRDGPAERRRMGLAAAELASRQDAAAVARAVARAVALLHKKGPRRRPRGTAE